jgi:hypothetical protein
MANDEHVAMLKKGVEAWNEWRGQNKSIRPDLSWAKLAPRRTCAGRSWARRTCTRRTARDVPGQGALHEADLRGADLTVADLRGGDLTVANLSGADLNNAPLYQTVFGVTTLAGVKGLSRCGVVRRRPNAQEPAATTHCAGGLPRHSGDLRVA